MASSIDAMAATLLSALWNDGGGTIDPRTGRLANLRTGFLVSLRRYGKQFVHWPARSDIAAWLTDVADALEASPNLLYPGIWHDAPNLAVWCDLNEFVFDETAAMELGIQEVQFTIRNNFTAENIPVAPLRRAA